MRALIKTALRSTLTPVMRLLHPVYEDLSRIHAYLILCALVKPSVDTSVVVLGTPEVHGTGNIYFGHDMLLYPGLYLETRGGSSIKFGDGVVMSRGVHVVSHAGITIGDGTMIGEYSSIRDANHVRDANGAMRNGAHSASAITIGKQVWIGRGVTVLPGVSIGDNATVGANAVVTRSVPAGATVVGVPAAPVGARKVDLVGPARL